MADPQLELYFYQQCGFSRSVLNTITNLGIADKITLKDIREQTEFEKELIAMCGDSTVPTLVVNGEAMRESDAINSFLVDNFLD
ncbi:MAG: glutathione S-transferase N-terminal domain-containing protein [Pseudomonadales bacterium]|jgi:glutaredoxin-related protein|nr:glutathione S-transferase N-terminal domain-containing protein [Pseudomonadales bacterium]MDP7360527.1 glutathione S-transferase N-terminal domain-containing protein [Pseudomonadales bacterium]MDP7597378.1 glutathione S-transferase N-terminal domain-containing protein [Pseudomonadales bacterium]HJN50401.1 glutathione S-transferase N-terminal domain-containing protein [Pseudomonadales bacterium]|tara:strand:- start:169 stop:420 length:252 start_codon:yes stop_codon:yes gene_type:complete